MCFYAVMKLRWKPSEFIFLPPKERALMYAFIKEQLEMDKKNQKKASSGSGSKSRVRRRR